MYYIASRLAARIVIPPKVFVVTTYIVLLMLRVKSCICCNLMQHDTMKLLLSTIITMQNVLQKINSKLNIKKLCTKFKIPKYWYLQYWILISYSDDTDQFRLVSDWFAFLPNKLESNLENNDFNLFYPPLDYQFYCLCSASHFLHV